MWVYLDDIREVKPGYVLAKTYKECIEYLKSGKVERLSLDHDLGTNKSGYDVCKWMVENNIKVPMIFIHTANPVGRDNMKQLLERYFPESKICIR